MKKFTKFALSLIGLGAAAGAGFAYLKDKGYITVTTGNDDEDYDDFSTLDAEGTGRTYINVDTEAMKEKAKEVAQDVMAKASYFADACKEKTFEFAEKAQDKAADITESLKDKAGDFTEEIKDMAEDVFEDAKEIAGAAKDTIASSIEKAWYEAEDKAETIEDFFLDED